MWIVNPLFGVGFYDAILLLRAYHPLTSLSRLGDTYTTYRMYTVAIMRTVLASRIFHYVIAGGLLCGAVFLLVTVNKDSNTDQITTVTEQGSVQEIVSVSGFVKAQNVADISFPLSGIVENVAVREGDHVEIGDTLITLKHEGLLGERQRVLAQIATAQADYTELLAGPTSEARSVTTAEVTQAKQNLEQTTKEQNEKVTNAYKILLSANLSALANAGDQNAIAPTISGSYSCAQEGVYKIETFNSSAQSGISYRISGLETGTYTGYTSQPTAFGACGLFIQFDPDSRYNNSIWTIAIPNKQASSYVTNKNAYDLAVEQARNTIEAAQTNYLLAQERQLLTNAAPRSEAVTRANAAIATAQSALTVIDAQIADRKILAPFAGIVSNLDIVAGEAVSTSPVITLLADSAFTITARVPEIDITKIAIGQNATLTFDAQSENPLIATVDFISPIATEIDGVAYFETTLSLTEPPTWLRGGLNADVDILVAEATDTVRVPKRFIITEDTATYVLVLSGEATSIRTPVTITFSGNDGFVAIEGVSVNTTIIAP